MQQASDLDLKGVDYGRMSAVLVEAIKELDQKLTEIEGRL